MDTTAIIIPFKSTEVITLDYSGSVSGTCDWKGSWSVEADDTIASPLVTIDAVATPSRNSPSVTITMTDGGDVSTAPSVSFNIVAKFIFTDASITPATLLTLPVSYSNCGHDTTFTTSPTNILHHFRGTTPIETAGASMFINDSVDCLADRVYSISQRPSPDIATFTINSSTGLITTAISATQVVDELEVKVMVEMVKMVSGSVPYATKEVTFLI